MRAVDHLAVVGVKTNVPNGSKRTAFKRNGPAMRILNPQILDTKMLDECQQNTDVPPVARLAFSIDTGIGAIGTFAQRLCAVAGSARMVRTFEKCSPNAPDMDVRQGLNIRDTESAVRASYKIITTSVREFEVAIFQN